MTKGSEPESRNDFYKLFEERYRGSSDEIKQKLGVYSPFLAQLPEATGARAAVDLGCGRGEWLELLAEAGFEAHGVDADEAMVAACAERGFAAKRADALDFLKATPSDSIAIVSAFHLIEHLPFPRLRCLVGEAHRCLAPGGLLLLETPNPENLRVGATSFYLDPTHIRPLPPLLLSFVAEFYGFARTKLLRLNESADLRDKGARVHLIDVIAGVSPDYSVIAQKAGGAHSEALDAAFGQTFGLTLNQLATRHDRQADDEFRRLAELQGKLDQKLEAMRGALSAQAQRYEREIAEIRGALSGYAARYDRQLEEIRGRLSEHTLTLEESSRSFQELGAWAVDVSKRHDQALGALSASVAFLEDRQGSGFFQAPLRFLQQRGRELYWTLTRLVGLSHWHDGSDQPGKEEIQAYAPGLVCSPVLADEPYEVKLAYRRLLAAETCLRAGPRPAKRSDERLRLAYFSPMPPEKTGVADYSADLLPALSQHYEIHVILGAGSKDVGPIQGCEAIHDVPWFERNAHTFDRIVYQMGNSEFHSHMLPLLEKFPGVVVMHDFFLGHFLGYLEIDAGLKGYWTRALYHAHGYDALRLRFEPGETGAVVRDCPANFFVLQQAQGVAVHSNFARGLARAFYGDRCADDFVIIPQSRPLPRNVNRTAARAALGLGEDDFLVCSFGFLGETKLNHRLLDAWLSSRLRSDRSCRLVFVGEAPNDPYCSQLRASIEAHAPGNIHITGYASASLYEQYLAAADAAVQLRCLSRGENSRAVLDCMAYALPTIVNSHGSMGELPDGRLIKLPDDFSIAELRIALESLQADPEFRTSLGRRARSLVAEELSPQRVAELYNTAIETFAAEAAPMFDMEALLDAAADVVDAGASEAYRLERSRELARRSPLKGPARQLLVDISALAREDLRSGIQRVVRAQLLGLLAKPPADFRIEPIYLSNEGGEWRHRYARRFTSGLLGLPADTLDDEVISVRPGDVYYMPDYFAHGVVQAFEAGVYDRLRESGVRLNFLIHDNLPVSHPEFFPDGAGELHSAWLRCLAASADHLICISNAVKDDAIRWLEQNAPSLRRRLQFSVVHHGADPEAAAATKGLPNDARSTLTQLALRPTFLMVGTVEPRKGHQQALDAFEELWARRVDVNLVIVGAEGWRPLPDDQRRGIPQIVKRLQTSGERGQRLFWLDGVSDEFLEKLYAASDCLIAASQNEGFGLPLIEAARHNLPILARDIPVFREVAGDHAAYFRGGEGADLAAAVTGWLELFKAGRHPKPDDLPWRSWAENVEHLKETLLDDLPRAVSAREKTPLAASL